MLHTVSHTYRTVVLDYMVFLWSPCVLCTGFTLGKYFVHVNISIIAPPGTWHVCFQVVCMYLLCVGLSVSVLTLVVCVLGW